MNYTHIIIPNGLVTTLWHHSSMIMLNSKNMNAMVANRYKKHKNTCEVYVLIKQ